MTAPFQNIPNDYEASEEELGKLIDIIEEVARGNYSNDIMEFTKPGHSEMIQRVAEAVGLMMVRVETREVHLEQLVHELKDLNRLLEKNTTQTVIAIAHALGARDKYTEGHAHRVSVYSERLARKLGLPDKELERIRVGGVLHDIGKIGFSDRIFSDEDISFGTGMVAEIHKHPEIGVGILKDLTCLGPILDYVHYHHESLDGAGYPEGLKGEEIPLGARIISVADCFDAITTNRPYHKGVSKEEAFAMLREISGKMSPELVEAFIEEIKENGML